MPQSQSVHYCRFIPGDQLAPPDADPSTSYLKGRKVVTALVFPCWDLER